MNNWISDKLKIDPLKKAQSFLSSELVLVNQLIEEKTKHQKDVIPVVSHYIFSSGGKKIRPILVLLCAKLFDYKGSEHIKLAAAVEFIHTATLLHDDVVDESYLRRGIDSANKIWDNKISVLVGDYLFSQAFCIISRVENREIIYLLSKTSSIIAEGEVVQMNSSLNINLSVEDNIEILKSKTAELFASACQVGASICNRSEIEKQSLRKFGMNLGIAFQIMDDLLDYTAKEEVLGKTLGKDLSEGKVTLPIIVAYEYSDEKDKTLLKEVFDNNVNEKDKNKKLEIIIEILEKYDVNNKVKNMAVNYINEAKNALDIIKTSKAKDLLLKILNFSIERVY